VRDDVKILFIATSVLVLACSLPSAAAENSAPNSPGRQPTGGDAGNDAISVEKTTQTETIQPMNMDEPMPTAMAKEGMKKGDVKAQAMKKAAAMDEMMKQEEMKK
jgi:hypothetical protein